VHQTPAADIFLSEKQGEKAVRHRIGFLIILSLIIISCSAGNVNAARGELPGRVKKEARAAGKMCSNRLSKAFD
jgi:hypothetical protein